MAADTLPTTEQASAAHQALQDWCMDRCRGGPWKALERLRVLDAYLKGAEGSEPAGARAGDGNLGRMCAGDARALIARLTAAVRGDDGDEIEAAMTAVSDALQRPWDARFTAPPRIVRWGHCWTCNHDAIPGEGCNRQACPMAAAAPAVSAPAGMVLDAFDKAIAAELPWISHREDDAHETCKYFAGKVRERLAAIQASITGDAA